MTLRTPDSKCYSNYQINGYLTYAPRKYLNYSRINVLEHKFLLSNNGVFCFLEMDIDKKSVRWDNNTREIQVTE